MEATDDLAIERKAKNEENDLSENDLRGIYKYMLLTRIADTQSIILQRQGRITFYVSCEGEEAAEVGSAFALEKEDWIFPDYRGSGIVITRGLDLTVFFAHLFGNSGDTLKGRSMPSHWGCRELNIVAPSSPICTQLPHAVGVGLGANLNDEKIAAIAYFGDGGTSSNDFHSALNFAAVFNTPTIFFCRNNGYAISVPVGRQTRTETLAEKALAYNFEGVRIDGNDPIAAYRATKKALEKAKSGGGPTLIEAVTYRLGAHTSSDDPSKYRNSDELENRKRSDPIVTFRSFLERSGVWTERDEEEARDGALRSVKEAILKAERMPPIEPERIIDDVYSEITWNLRQQAADLLK